MQKLLRRYEVHPEFLKTVLSFGIEPNVADVASSTLHISPVNNEQTVTMYLLNYVELNNRNSEKPWSFRRTAIYHDKRSDFDFFLILHPNDGGSFNVRFEKLCFGPSPQATQIQKLLDMPSRLHLLLLSSYIDNWRQYITFLADTWEDENDLALGVEPQKAQADDSFFRVQRLRHINDLANFVLASCSGSLDLVTRLKDNPRSLLHNSNELESLATSVSGSIASSNAFVPRIRNTIELVCVNLVLTVRQLTNHS
jgi:hypothetical protein